MNPFVKPTAHRVSGNHIHVDFCGLLKLRLRDADAKRLIEQLQVALAEPETPKNEMSPAHGMR